MVAESTIESDTADSLRKNVFEGITFICSLSKKNTTFDYGNVLETFIKQFTFLGINFFHIFFFFCNYFFILPSM